MAEGMLLKYLTIMRRILIILLTLLPVFGWAQADFTQAERALRWLRAGQGDSLATIMTPQVKAQITPAMLGQIWQQLERQAGPFQSAGAWSETTAQGHRVQVCPLTFAQAGLQLTLTLDAADQVAGIFFAPVETPAAKVPAEAPDTVAQGQYVERDVTVDSGSLHLPGTLCLPRKAIKGRTPIVVFVHGSGPNDRQESLGPNRPFRDMAHALAARGIGSLRYDKRTLVYREQAATVPMGDYDCEVTDDAVAAMLTAARQPETDTMKIYVMGHSLGGALAPRVAAKCPFRPGGVIMWSAPVRPLDELLRDQLRYLARQEGRSEASADSAAEMLLSYLPEGYVEQARRYKPTRQTRLLPIPQLYIAGGHDYQVTRDDFDAWKRVFEVRTDRHPEQIRPGKGRRPEGARRSGARRDRMMPVHPVWAQPEGADGAAVRAPRMPRPRFVWLDDADHLLRSLPEMARPADYNAYHPVSSEAIDLIAGFILGPSPKR